MGTIPTHRQIAANFRHDVVLQSWREHRDPASAIVNFTGPQKDLFDYLMRIMAPYERERRTAVAALRTAADVLRRGAEVRRILREVQGLAKLSEKTPRTPLRAKVTGGFVRDGFRVEHVILQSRPGLYVTGNMYLPTRFKPPFPAVLHVCGHTTNGKAGYQRLSALLATKGIAVFCFDPAGQGERDEYVDLATGRRTVRRACRSHQAAGDVAYLLGTNFGEYRLWDGIRCVDYLQARPDIIASRIGVTGMSGGGWASLWLGAIDPRLKAINSNLYTTTFRRRMEGRGQDAEGDPEQDPFGLLARGIDAADLLIACLPRAVSLGATRGDFFPFDGAMAAYRDARRMFKLAGMGDRLAITVDDGGHQMTPAIRRACCRWMLTWLKGEQDPDDSDIEIPDEPEERTWCTKTGIVLTSLGGVTTAELNARRARKLAIERQRQTRGMAPTRRAAVVCRRLAELLKYKSPVGPVRVDEGKPRRIGSLLVIPLKIKTDDGMWLTGHLWNGPPATGLPAIVCLTRKDADYDPFANESCAALARGGVLALDLDVRGSFTKRPLAEQWLDFTPLVEGDLTYDSFLLGRPIMGMRVADVVRGVQYLLARKDVDRRRVGVYGQQYTALLALLAACMDKRIAAVCEEEPLASWSSLVWHRDYAWGPDMVLPGALEHLDLTDLRSAIAPRKLSIHRPLDHHRLPLSPAAVRAQFATVLRAFKAAGATQNLTISTGLSGDAIDASTQTIR